MAFDQDFLTSLDDPQNGLATDFGTPSDVLMMCFGGLAGELSVPPFEFLRFTEQFPTKRVLVRDLEQCWYQRGVRGLGATIDEVADSLRSIVSDAKTDHLVTIGTSAGGFAAMVYGALLGADRTLVFSPQSFVNWSLCIRHRDRRWPAERKKARQNSPGPLDVRPVLQQYGIRDLRVVIGSESRRDVAHAGRLVAIPNTTISVLRGPHELVRDMRTDGSLVRWLGDVLTFD